MADYQSSYTGAQLDAAIASYVNRSTGQIVLTPDQLNGSLSDGYYSGISASIDTSSLTATASDILSGTTAITASGKTSGGMQSGSVAFTLTPSSLSQSQSPNKFVTSASASLNYSSLTAAASDVSAGKLFVGANGYQTGTMTPIQMGTISAGTNNYTTYTITGLTGTPTSIILVGAGWSGDTAANSGRVTKLWKIPGNADYYHYGINAYYNGTIEYHADSAGSGGTANKSAVEAAAVFNHSAGTCVLTLPILYRNSSSSRQCFLRQAYTWVVW